MKAKLLGNISAIVFLLLIFSLTIFNFLKPKKEFSESENRFLAQFPKFSFASLAKGEFTAGVEKYITDQFIFRDEFVGVKTQTEFLSGKKDSSGVYFGKDGYLIEKHDASDIDNDLLEKNITRLNDFMEYSENKLGNGHAFAIIVPTASDIMQDKLPHFATQFDQSQMLNTIATDMKHGVYIDAQMALRDAYRNNEQLFYKTDHHWTTAGAFCVYNEWLSQVGLPKKVETDYEITTVTDEFYGTIYSKAALASTKPDKIESYILKENPSFKVDYNMGSKKTDTLYVDSSLGKRDKYSYFLGGNNAVVKITSQNKNGKKLMLIKDSFAHSFAPFIANDFEEVHMMDLRYLNMSMKDYMAQNGITDVMMLYNAVSFAKETTLVNLNR